MDELDDFDVEVVVVAREDSLSRALGRAHLMYAQYVHRLHGRLGHFWQNRFYSRPMDEARAHNAAAYIELNPVRAGMSEHPWDYAWSSAAAHCGKGDRSGLLALDQWLEQMPLAEWRGTLQSIASFDETIERLRVHAQTDRPLGSDSFLSKVETLLGHRIRANPVGQPKGRKDKSKRTHHPKSQDQR